MHYQDNDAVENGGADSTDGLHSLPEVQKDPNSARNIQIMIIIGLVAAIGVAIFGSF